MIVIEPSLNKIKVRDNVSATIRGHEVRGVNLTVNGTVNANVVAEGKLSLSRSARLEGDVVVDARVS